MIKPTVHFLHRVPTPDQLQKRSFERPSTHIKSGLVAKTDGEERGVDVAGRVGGALFIRGATGRGWTAGERNRDSGSMLLGSRLYWLLRCGSLLGCVCGVVSAETVRGDSRGRREGDSLRALCSVQDGKYIWCGSWLKIDVCTLFYLCTDPRVCEVKVRIRGRA